ncbi:hypothetical protein [Novosphingobium sp. M1R2S20]|uniref:Uncharacterized protein n=1 Tax=Novosphingobium rhizovicinum TaxID=3228928 RepID=A0ABV3RA43_9SPHN
MATAKTMEVRQHQPSRWRRNLVLLACALAVAIVAFFWGRMRETSLASTAYSAQTACLCRFAASRSLEACEADPGVSRPWVTLSEDVASRSLTARVPGIAEQTARWSPRGGCMLEPWSD